MNSEPRDRASGRPDHRGSKGPLAGVRLLDLGGAGPVPFCAMVLRDMGAEVVSIDRPRLAANELDEVATLTEGAFDRGRSPLVVDLKSAGGIELVLDLLPRFDGLMEGFRPGVAERLGLGPSICMARNPKLVYGRMTGWGQNGPLSNSPGHDINYLALSGALAPIGAADRPPVPPLNLVADFGGGGMLLAVGMLAGLVDAMKSGIGQVIDAAMVDGSSLMMTMMYAMHSNGSWVLRRESNINDGGAPFYHVYETADHRYVAVGAMERRFYDALVSRLGLDSLDLPDQWDREHWPMLTGILAEAFMVRTRDQWTAIFANEPVCVTPVLGIDEAPLHPHNIFRSTFTGAEGNYRPAPAPRFSRYATDRGEAPTEPRSTAEQLIEFGIASDRIDGLRAAGTII